MFNIVALEMRLEELNPIEDKLKDPNLRRKIHDRHQTVQSQLVKLTKNDYAANVLEQMVEATRRE